MHFALVIPELHKHGGTERCVASLAEALERRGHRFTVFSSYREAGVLPGATWHWVPMIRRPHIPRFFSFFLAQELVRRLATARGEHFDVVFSTGPDVLRPTVTVFHCSAAGILEKSVDADCHYPASFVAKLKRWNNRLSYGAIAIAERVVVRHTAHSGVAISRTLKNELESFHGSEASRIHVLPDGVDPAEFRPFPTEVRLRARQALRIEARIPVVLFVGHNWSRKGLMTLVDAIAKLRREQGVNSILVVVGTGDTAAKQRIEQALQGNVRFLGRRKDMAGIYGLADVLALPTLHDAFGLPVLEAMACGVPVVVSRLAGVAELMTDGQDGLLLDHPTDVGELAAKLRQLLTDQDSRTRIATAARATAARYSWDALAERFEQICCEAVKPNNR